MPSTVWTIALPIKVRPTNSLTQIWLLQLSPPPWCLGARFTATAVQKQIYYQLQYFWQAIRQTLWVLEVQKGLPIAALPCLPAGLQSKFTATVETSVSSQRERGETERGSERAVWDFFPFLRCPDMQSLQPRGPLKSARSLIVVSWRLRERNAWQSLNGNTKAHFCQALKFSFSPSYCSRKNCFLLNFLAAAPCPPFGFSCTFKSWAGYWTCPHVSMHMNLFSIIGSFVYRWLQTIENLPQGPHEFGLGYFDHTFSM